MPLLLINFLCHLVRLFIAPAWEQGFWVIFSAVLILLPFAARSQILTVQNRVIRLEEQLRYRSVLPAELADKASVLSLGQMIALRFASDAELPGLVERTLAGEFATPKEIKQAIKNWRADELRA